MKSVISIVLLTLLAGYSHAQRVLLSGDTTKQITLDSTGYAQEHPQDISEEAGLFIYSKDGREAIRIYGSFRLLSVYDNRKNFHPYDLTQPTIPTGSTDFYYPNSIWNINMSRLGFDALIGSNKLNDMLIRIEFDWKGDNEKFRIRHLFLRNENWLLGKTWSSFNNVSYLIQAVDGRFSGGAVGTRPTQVRYYNKINRWKYQFSLEYAKPSLVQPDTLGAEAVNLIPDFAINIGYESRFLKLMLAGVLRSNRVQYTINAKGNQSLPGYGGILALMLDLNENNRLKSSASGGVGIGSLLGDFAFVPMDLAFNSSSQEFESITVYTAYVGLEHDWSSQFTSSLGWGVTGTQEQAFYNDGFYKEGSKTIANLFYRPKTKMKHLTVAAEVEYAERRNIETDSNNTTRASFLFIYDF
jgi:hypothetical protein